MQIPGRCPHKCGNSTFVRISKRPSNFIKEGLMTPKGKTRKSQGLVFLPLILLLRNYYQKIGWIKEKVSPWVNLHLITETVPISSQYEQCISHVFLLHQSKFGEFKTKRPWRPYLVTKDVKKKIYQRYVKNIKALTIACVIPIIQLDKTQKSDI